MKLQGPLLSGEQIDMFREEVYGYYRNHGRDLPWRRTRDEYSILVSEVMLQQTQVERVMGKYMEFLRIFPTFCDLAASPLRDVLAAWQGLGYNRRALALTRAAEIVMTRYSGSLPRTVAELSDLPGIGKPTASAILCFAFDQPEVFIETNVRRVFIQYFFGTATDVRDKEILPFVAETVDPASPRDWYYALMDYGSMLGKTGRNANRRSAFYRRQSPFGDSDRRIRGIILKLLCTETHTSVSRLERETGTEPGRVRTILERMEKEGLVKEQGGEYGIG